MENNRSFLMVTHPKSFLYQRPSENVRTLWASLQIKSICMSTSEACPFLPILDALGS